MGWLILRTDFRKEHYVASQIQAMFCDPENPEKEVAWVPCQIITSRSGASRRVTAKAAIVTKKLPLLPRRIFAAVPMWAVHQAELDGIRHFEGFERDAENRVLSVPDGQIEIFRAEVAKENANALALVQMAGKRQKAKWKAMHDAIAEWIERAKQQMEQAA